MKPNSQLRKQKLQVLVVSIAAMLAVSSLTAVSPLYAATPEPAKAPVSTATAKKPARQCLTDLSAFQGQMQKDGYWRGFSGYGYGYPTYGYGYDTGVASPALIDNSALGAGAYSRAECDQLIRWSDIHARRWPFLRRVSN